MDISGWASDFFGQIGDLIDDLLIKILSILPDSPFTYLQKYAYVYKYIQYINWIIPVNFIISTLETWLVAVAIYYIYQLVLRWLKAIE